MRYKKNGLVSLLACFTIGCFAHPLILKSGVTVKYSDNDYFYYYTPIGKTGYYVVGKGRSSFIAEIESKDYLRVINEVLKPKISDLEKVDEEGRIKWVIEPKEYEELKYIRILRNLQDSVSK